QLAKDEGSKNGKNPLIYRSLSWLEKEGFIEINRSEHKHGYRAGISNIEVALEKLVSNSIREYESELKKIDSEIGRYTMMENRIPSIVKSMVDVGKKKVDKPVFAQGWKNIIKLLDDKVYMNAKKGDVIRITLDWLAQGKYGYTNKERLKNMERLYQKGIETRTIDHDRSEKKIRGVLKELLLDWRERGYKMEYKVYPRNDATYEFIARNAEGLVLVVSESPLSATWISRDENPDLVDDAIATFDEDFLKGIDLAEYEE
ncbi:MAG: hypothetical protein ACFFEE_10395, partial [Candidatus Thorarchaeota archaeon]